MPTSQGSISATTTAQSKDLEHTHNSFMITNDGSASVYISFSDSPSKVSSSDGFELKTKETLSQPVNFRYINFLAASGTQALRYFAHRRL